MNTLVRVSVGLLAAVALSAPFRAQTTTAPADLSGSLANGLRYVIQPHGAGLDRVSVRLIVHAGSLDERDHERGYAHFVEHMAFNGTRHYPPGKLVEFFQSLGLSFGADLLASTSFTHTIYKIDLPTGRTARLGEALQVLRDFADGIAFAPAEVQREKGVVLSELAARDTAQWKVNAQEYQALYAGTAVPDRYPAGTRAAIAQATADSLRAYYQRCYRPDRMTVVVVGDIAPADAREAVEKNFGSMSATSPIVPPAKLDAPAATGLRAHVIIRPQSPAATVQLVTFARQDTPTPAARHESTARNLVMALLDERLARRRAQAMDRFGDAEAEVQSGPSAQLRHYVVSANAAGRDWPAALRLIESELRRAREQGFTAAEVRERVSAVLAQRRADRDFVSGETPDLVAERIVDALCSGQPWPSPNEAVSDTEAFLSRFTPALAHATLRSLFAENRLHLLLFAPQAPDGGPAAVLSAYREAASLPLDTAAAAGAGDLVFRYSDFGAPGTFAERHTEADLAIERVRFANGVRLNVRSSTTEPGQFRLTALFGRGIADLPRDRPGLPHLAVHLIGDCDLGRHTREEVKRLLDLRAVRSHAGFSRQFVVSMEGPTRELSFALQVLAARVTDVRLDPARLTAAQSDYNACRSASLDTGAAHAMHEALLLMGNGDPRLSEPSVSQLNGYTFADIAAWAREHWLEGALEVGIIGDFTSAAAIDAVAASLGTLPPRRIPAPADPGERPTLRTQPTHEVRPKALGEQVAAVQLTWPAPGLHDLRRRWALRLATDVLTDRLQKILRQELGATYSPEGTVEHDALHRERGFAAMALTFEPSRAEELVRRAIAIADDLARQGVSAEEFSRLRAPLVAGVNDGLRSNEWWLGAVLAFAQSEPAALDDARQLAAVVAALTHDDVNRAAADHFRSTAASSVIVMPVAPATDAVAADTAVGHSRRGEERFRQGDIAGAYDAFSRAIALDPSFAPAYSNRAAVRMQQGDAAGAIADCSKAIELDPKISLAYSNRGGAKVGLGDLDGAIADCNEALRVDPKNSEAHNNRGIARARKGDIDGALADWNKAIELNPGNAMAFANRGRMKVDRGDFDGAIADELTALQLQPAYPDAWVNLATARQGKGEFDAAIADYTKALTLNPNLPHAHRNRGKLRQARGDQAGAIADFDQVLRVNPGDADTLIDRGVARHSRKDFDGALADFDASIALQPNNAGAYANRAGARLSTNAFDGAIADGTKAIELNPTLPDAYNNRGFARQARGDLDGAIADYTKAIELNPKLALPYQNRANARKAKGDRFGAMDDFDQALKLSAPVAPTAAPPAVATSNVPSPAPAKNKTKTKQKSASQSAEAAALVRSGLAKQSQRDYAGAIADYDQAIALQPKHVTAHYNRGLAHQAKLDHPAAIRDFDAALTLNPGHVPAYNARGFSRQARGNFAGAIADYSAAIDRSATYPPAYFNRGFARQVKGELPAALADYNTLIELAPTYAGAHSNRGNVRHATGDFEGALADYEQAITATRTSTHYPRLFRALVQRRLQRGDPGPDLAAAIRTWPAGWTRTIGRFLTGELTESQFLAASTEGTGRTPLSRPCEAHYFAGMVLLLEKDAAGARAHFEKSAATNQIRLSTFMLARAELARLSVDGAENRPAPGR